MSSKWLKIILISTVLTFFMSTLTMASQTTNIYVNGIPLALDVQPVNESGSMMVPFRAIAEFLGCEVDYNSENKVVTLSKANDVIRITVDSKIATINGKSVEMPVAAKIFNDRTFVPLRFVGEALNSKVKWQQGYNNQPNEITISNENPVQLPGGNAAIGTKVFSYSKDLGKNDGGYETTLSYDMEIPQFYNMKNSDLQNELNAYFLNDKEMAIEYLNEQLAEMQSSDYRYSLSEDRNFSVIRDKSGLLSLLYMGYSYSGGAHGMPFMIGMNIDFNESKLLNFADIFVEGKDYEKELLQIINNELKNKPDVYADLFEPTITELPGDNGFYFMEDNLIVYYTPYEIGPYSMGFVDFKIPLAKLGNFLKPQYK